MVYKNIQALRAFAAFAVLAHHLIFLVTEYIGIGRAPIPFVSFESGVDIFFVVSGFVMAASARQQSPGAFATARIARIVPLYWLATFTAAFALLLGFRIFNLNGFDPEDFAQSLFFLPIFDPAGYAINPIVYVGWSLNYEMLFYALFTVSLFFPDGWARENCVFTLIIALIAAGALTQNSFLRYWGNPVILEFAAGMLIWRLTQRAVLSKTLAVLAITAGVSALIAAGLWPEWRLATMRVVFYGLPAVLIVLGFVSLERNGITLGSGFLQRQGNASYALYLTHIFTLQAVGKTSILLGLNQSAAGIVLSVAIAGALALFVGTLTHKHVEKPLTAAARRVLTPAQTRAG
ncbi:MAG: acyltransferase [Caulobacterales bacterium]